MALYLKQNDTRSELQKRVASELQEKAKKAAEPADLPDGVTDSQFIRGTTGTGRYAWIWVLGIVLIVLGLIVLIVATAR